MKKQSLPLQKIEVETREYDQRGQLVKIKTEIYSTEETRKMGFNTSK